MKVAIASDDGRTIASHLGRARGVIICEVGPGQVGAIMPGNGRRLPADLECDRLGYEEKYLHPAVDREPRAAKRRRLA